MDFLRNFSSVAIYILHKRNVGKRKITTSGLKVRQNLKVWIPTSVFVFNEQVFALHKK